MENEISFETEINFDSFYFNQRISEAYSQLKTKNYSNSLKIYDDLINHIENQLSFLNEHNDSSFENIRLNLIFQLCFTKSCLGLCYFEDLDYQNSGNEFEDSLKYISILKNNNYLSDHLFLLEIKILANLIILNLILSNFEQSSLISKEIETKINSLYIYIYILFRDLSTKNECIQILISILFKFESFQQIGEGYFENIEKTFSNEVAACFYSSMAINRQLINEYELSLKYHLMALDIYMNLNMPFFVLISLKFIIHLSNLLNLKSEDIKDYIALFSKIVQTDELKNLKIDYLFYNFEKKILSGQEITKSLKKIEDYTEKQKINEANSKLKRKLSHTPIEKNNLCFWKQALKIRLLNTRKILISNKKNYKNKNYELVIFNLNSSKGIDQINNTLKLLSNEQNKTILLNLENCEYTKMAIFNLKANMNKLRKIKTKQYYQEFFQILFDRFQKKKKEFIEKKEMKENKALKLINQAVESVSSGDYLIKINKDTNGRIRRFFQIEDQFIKWSSKKSGIYKPKVSKYPLLEIRALLYGKATNPLMKKYNQKLEPWLCFSLIFSKRSLDFYCREDQIKHWVIGLSAEIEETNHEAFIIRPGQFFWRKMKLLMMYYYFFPQQEKAKVKKICSFVKCIKAYAKSL